MQHRTCVVDTLVCSSL